LNGGLDAWIPRGYGHSEQSLYQNIFRPTVNAEGFYTDPPQTGDLSEFYLRFLR